jgi:hypothetical protein
VVQGRLESIQVSDRPVMGQSGYRQGSRVSIPDGKWVLTVPEIVLSYSPRCFAGELVAFTKLIMETYGLAVQIGTVDCYLHDLLTKTSEVESCEYGTSSC